MMMYGTATCAGFPGLRDLTFAEALLWPQVPAIKLIWSFADKSPIVSTSGAFVLILYIIKDIVELLIFVVYGPFDKRYRYLVKASGKMLKNMCWAVIARVLWPILPWWLYDLVRALTVYPQPQAPSKLPNTYHPPRSSQTVVCLHLRRRGIFDGETDLEASD